MVERWERGSDRAGGREARSAGGGIRRRQGWTEGGGNGEGMKNGDPPARRIWQAVESLERPNCPAGPFVRT